ncbi:MAG: 8-oxoguanine DNA glycosylase [Lachnospiraceae bacterium]|nr:8-oxoguanine DNA glycosylase [Lachnospiraceae bacterium]
MLSDKLDHFNIRQIAESGQCFRIREIEPGRWVVPSGERCITLTCHLERSTKCGVERSYLTNGVPDRDNVDSTKILRLPTVAQDDKTLFQDDKTLSQDDMTLSQDDVLLSQDDMRLSQHDIYWARYFDLSRDYSAIESAIRSSGDAHLIEAFNSGSGIRILKQDLWETIISFMISQNNNIKRIAGSIEKLCKLADRKIKGFEDVFAFPKPEDLDPAVFDDTSLGLGYRAGCIRDMFVYTASHPEWLKELREAPYEDAKRLLMDKKGIGPKVSDCICLFALSHVDAWPVDTHVKQLVAKYYPNGFDFERYKGFAGIIQQYLFYYEIKK